MGNANGTPETLTPAAELVGNTRRGRHGIYSPAMREARATEIADRFAALEHAHPIDRIAAEQVGRAVALVEVIQAELDRVGLAGAVPRVGLLLDQLGKAERRLTEVLKEFAGTPVSRARWRRELAEGDSLAASAARRRAARRADAETTAEEAP